MSKNKLALILIVLGFARIVFSVVSIQLGLKIPSSTLLTDLVIIATVLTLAICIWGNETRLIYANIAVGFSLDLGVRAIRAYINFVVLPGRGSQMLMWALLEFLPGILLWSIAFYLVYAYLRRRDDRNMQTSTTEG